MEKLLSNSSVGVRGGSVVECRTPEREVLGSKPTAAVLCPWARHFTPRKYWFITQEVVAPSRHDWKIVDWDVKHQHKQTIQECNPFLSEKHTMSTSRSATSYGKIATYYRWIQVSWQYWHPMFIYRFTNTSVEPVLNSACCLQIKQKSTLPR